MGFPLVLKLVTLNDISVISGWFGGKSADNGNFYGPDICKIESCILICFDSFANFYSEI